ncbi:MAG: DUF72 domain-containing protein [Candidatus Heimdallarchaeaceae archaeon]
MTLGEKKGKVYVGCTGFNYEDWMAKYGGFYPPKIEKYNLLSFYSTQFITCEINSTFYAFPRPSAVSRWAKQLPEDFVLTAKIPKEICQAQDISITESKLKEFLRILKPLEKNLGPLVCQFAPSFEKTSKTKKQLEVFLSFYPLERYDLAVEFRHTSWFEQETYDLLNENKIGIVSSFLPYLQFNLFEEVKKEFFYLRLIGSHKLQIGQGKETVERTTTMEETAKMMQESFSKHPNKKSAYVFINNHFSGYAPPAAKKMKEILEKRNFLVIEPKKKDYKGQRKLSLFF